MTTTRSAPTSTSTSSTPHRVSGLQRAAGAAAFVKAATYLIGFGFLGAYLAPRGFLDAQGDPTASLAFLLDNQVAQYAWYAVLYIVGGIALVSLVLGVQDRMRPTAPGLSATAGVFGHIWSGALLATGMIGLVGQLAVVELAASDPALATSTWSAVSVIQDALGGGVEILGALWVLLVGVAGIRTGVWGRALSSLAIGAGVAGAATLIPPVADLAASLFGLSLIVWFVWAGVSLRRGARQPV